MFPVKHTVIYTFFAITSVQNTCFCSVFNALASKNPAKSCYVHFFFIFGRFSIAGKLPKWPKIPFQYPLALRHPKILEKCRKHHRILVSVRNRFWAPPAKADIATAILTNVIEHLVLLFCPPISTPSPPKRCGRILVMQSTTLDIVSQTPFPWHQPLQLGPLPPHQDSLPLRSTCRTKGPFGCGVTGGDLWVSWCGVPPKDTLEVIENT